MRQDRRQEDETLQVKLRTPPGPEPSILKEKTETVIKIMTKLKL